MNRHPTVRLPGLALVALALLARPAAATWSIIVIDLRTKEIAIGSATCVPYYDLRQLASVVVVGVGAAAAQSYVDNSGQNRLLIRDQLRLGTSPDQILVQLAARDPGHQTRQYGIVDTQGRALGFTGTSCGAYANHVVGRAGDLVWAIQGNVITGLPVLQAAEYAVANVQGDLATKLMAAMQAARYFGGDGRCSCPQSTPPGCGSPPPSFTITANIGYMIVARQGDTDGGCDAGNGCATGVYYMRLDVANQPPTAPDAVVQLQQLYDQWRATLNGRTDHHLSTVTLGAPSLPADGMARTTATVTLRDWRGQQLAAGGATVQVSLEAGGPPVTVGPVTDAGNGTYTFPVTAGTAPGTALLRIQVNDGQRTILLSPRTPVKLDSFWASRATLPGGAGGTVDFTLNAGAGFAGRGYLALASASGSVPGIPGPGFTVPLNPDALFFVSYAIRNSAILQMTEGTLDGSGRAAARLVAPAGLLLPFANQTLTFAFAALNPLGFASNPVAMGVTP